jgi:hypothetical protein
VGEQLFGLQRVLCARTSRYLIDLSCKWQNVCAHLLSKGLVALPPVIPTHKTTFILTLGLNTVLLGKAQRAGYAYVSRRAVLFEALSNSNVSIDLARCDNPSWPIARKSSEPMLPIFQKFISRNSRYVSC